MPATAIVVDSAATAAPRRGVAGARAVKRAQRVRKVDTVPTNPPFASAAQGGTEPRERPIFSLGPLLATRGAID